MQTGTGLVVARLWAIGNNWGMEIESPVLAAIVLVVIWMAHRILKPNDSAPRRSGSSLFHDSADHGTGPIFDLRDTDGDGIPDFLDHHDDS